MDYTVPNLKLHEIYFDQQGGTEPAEGTKVTDISINLKSCSGEGFTKELSVYTHQADSNNISNHFENCLVPLTQVFDYSLSLCFGLRQTLRKISDVLAAKCSAVFTT